MLSSHIRSIVVLALALLALSATAGRAQITINNDNQTYTTLMSSFS
jgi:hypothetical protein